jgi:hypothetical protein
MSFIFDTLYGIGLKNKIKEWNINVIDKNNHSLVVYSYGYLNSSKVECTKIIYSDSTDNSHYQIAILYAQQKWKDKLECGYNTDIECIKKYIKDDKVSIKNDVPIILDGEVSFY